MHELFTFITFYTHSDIFFPNLVTYFVLVSLLSTPVVGEFTKQIQKLSTKFVASIRLSLSIRPPADPPAHTEQLGSNWTDFPEIYTGNFYFKLLR